VHRKFVRYAGIALICLLTSVGSGTVSAAGQNPSPNLDKLAGFRGRVLVASNGLGTPNPLVVDQSSSTDGSYQVAYHAGNGRATVKGNAGRDAFDSELKQTTQGCSSDKYCSSGKGATGGATTEVFSNSNLNVHGSPAVLEHTTGGPTPGWNLVWYDSSSNTTYSLDLSDSMSSALAGGTDPTNVALGETVTKMAEGLAPLSPTDKAP
jgi:hypothetical protein